MLVRGSDPTPTGKYWFSPLGFRSRSGDFHHASSSATVEVEMEVRHEFAGKRAFTS
jgi:hypothetical protein